eukprot:TRINITY_DN2019_c0_g1_i1.p1 TRINITY_DN2019_c0_g1~~TRINITY_DN2019_c0_g1_i1.p1  ORF type:complete len:1842 (+),score=394.87 TRINITY_DN2019_c0_g1_i1:30-5528(+)
MNDGLKERPYLSCRIVHIDYYSSKKSYFDKEIKDNGKFANVIRIIGSSSCGQKCCLHIHGFYPYFYILAPSNAITILDSMKYLLNNLLNNFGDNNGLINLKIVKSFDIYGYHEKENVFFKVVCRTNSSKKYLIDVFRKKGRTILKSEVCLFEAHTGMISQFLQDYGLCGMDFISLKDAYFRVPLPNRNSLDYDEIMECCFDDLSNNTYFHGEDLNLSLLSKDSLVAIEADCRIEHIIPLHKYSRGQLSHSDFDQPMILSLRNIFEEQERLHLVAGKMLPEVESLKPELRVPPISKAQTELKEWLKDVFSVQSQGKYSIAVNSYGNVNFQFPSTNDELLHLLSMLQNETQVSLLADNDIAESESQLFETKDQKQKKDRNKFFTQDGPNLTSNSTTNTINSGSTKASTSSGLSNVSDSRKNNSSKSSSSLSSLSSTTLNQLHNWHPSNEYNRNISTLDSGGQRNSETTTDGKKCENEDVSQTELNVALSRSSVSNNTRKVHETSKLKISGVEKEVVDEKQNNVIQKKTPILRKNAIFTPKSKDTRILSSQSKHFSNPPSSKWNSSFLRAVNTSNNRSIHTPDPDSNNVVNPVESITSAAVTSLVEKYSIPLHSIGTDDIDYIQPQPTRLNLESSIENTPQPEIGAIESFYKTYIESDDLNASYTTIHELLTPDINLSGRPSSRSTDNKDDPRQSSDIQTLNISDLNSSSLDKEILQANETKSDNPRFVKRYNENCITLSNLNGEKPQDLVPSKSTAISSLMTLNLRSTPEYTTFYSQRHQDKAHFFYEFGNLRFDFNKEKPSFDPSFGHHTTHISMNKLMLKIEKQKKFENFLHFLKRKNVQFYYTLPWKVINSKKMDYSLIEPKRLESHNIIPTLKFKASQIESNLFTFPKHSNKGKNNSFSNKLKAMQFTNKHLNQNLKICSFHLLAFGEEHLTPQPKLNSVLSVAIATCSDDFENIMCKLITITDNLPSLSNNMNHRKNQAITHDITKVSSERALFEYIIDYILVIDPDIFLSFNIHDLGWLYFIERGKELEIDVLKTCSRLKSTKYSKKDDKIPEFEVIEGKKQMGNLYVNRTDIAGRIVLNLWKLLRHEIKLFSYQFEYVCEYALNMKLPVLEYTGHSYDATQLANYNYFVCKKSVLVLLLIQKFNIVLKTSEFSRIIGSDFKSILNRGSQFRVESVLHRLTKPCNYLTLSPSIFQVQNQRIPECVPLILEPKSGLHTDPVAVFDFRSLYPSVIIAHNICYSTCLGKIPPKEALSRSLINVALDMHNFNISTEHFRELVIKDQIFVSGTGSLFVTPDVKVGFLPKMLSEILSSRVLVKHGMKAQNLNLSENMINIQHARQLLLKMVANVTYGYTSAGFSGRMPCIEIAESIVQLGREYLEWVINFVLKDWEVDCEIVYGDTDSIFIKFAGRTVEEVFILAEELCTIINKQLPAPMYLEFEKIYNPLFLLSKKRYCGLKFVRPNSKPEIESKGTELTRLDQCHATHKILKNMIEIMIKTKYDLSQVKEYVLQMFTKVSNYQLNPIDFVFTREVKLGKYVNPPPAANLALRKIEADERLAPRYAERIPYLIFDGHPKQLLINMAGDPVDLVKYNMIVNTEYYIKRQFIPIINRFLNVCGADCALWWRNHKKRSYFRTRFEQGISNKVGENTPFQNQKYSIIGQGFTTYSTCLICFQNCNNNCCCCDTCLLRSGSIGIFYCYLNHFHKHLTKVGTICRGCSKFGSCFQNSYKIKCVNSFCPIFYHKHRLLNRVKFFETTLSNIEKRLKFLHRSNINQSVWVSPNDFLNEGPSIDELHGFWGNSTILIESSTKKVEDSLDNEEIIILDNTIQL